MLLVSTTLYFLTAVVVCVKYLGTFSITKLIISFFITSFSINVLISELLSLVRLLDKPWAYIGVQLLFCSALCVVLLITQKGDLRQSIKGLLPIETELRGFDFVLLGLIVISLGTLFYMGISTPPNNLDSLHTHLTRIYYWLQHGSLAAWPATGLFQLIYPVNAHLQGLWLVLLGRSENLFFLVPWASLIVICCAVYETARMLELTPRQSLISVVVLLAFPVVLLQVYSFQNDLAVAALLMIAVWATLRYTREKRLADLIVAMLAITLALGVKQTAFFVLPIFLVVFLILLIRKQLVKKHIPWLGLVIPFFLIFSFYKYGQNLLEFHSFFGVEDVLSGQRFNLSGLLDKTSYNAPRFLYDFIDFGGLGHTLEISLVDVKANLFERLYAHSRIDLQSDHYLATGFDENEKFSFLMNFGLSEDTAWFGPLFFIVAPFSLIIAFLLKHKTRRAYAALAVLHFVIYFLIILVQRPGWDPYQGRYFILAVVPLAPIFGVLTPRKGFGKWAIALLLFFITIVISFNTLMTNNSKPVFTSRSVAYLQNEVILPLPETNKLQIVGKTYLVKLTNGLLWRLPQREPIIGLPYYDQLFYSDTDIIPVIEMIQNEIPADEPIYLMMNRDPLEYALFGINRTRELFPVKSADQVPGQGYLLVDKMYEQPLMGFDMVFGTEQFKLYRRSE